MLFPALDRSLGIGSSMFKKAAHRGLMNRLVTQHGVNEGLAYALSSACYPSKRDQLPVQPQIPPKDVARKIDAWERSYQPPLKDLVISIFGEDQLDDLDHFIKLSAHLKQQGL